MAHYASDAVGYPPGEPTVIGTSALRPYFETYFQDTAFAATFQPVSVEVSSDGTMGSTLNSADRRATGPAGKIMAERIRDFHVCRKQADAAP